MTSPTRSMEVLPQTAPQTGVETASQTASQTGVDAALVDGSGPQDRAGFRPRLLAGLSDGQRVTRLDLSWHLAIHGPLALAVRKRGHGVLVAKLEASALRGRGGASFPLADKLAAVQDGRRRPIVVVNGCEGEPLSSKDATLLARCPHLVLDGAQALATDSAAIEVIVCFHADRPGVEQSIRAAINERVDRDQIPTRLFNIPAGYVAGQASALVHFINGGPPTPTTRPPHTSTKGIDGRPTLVCNAETYAHVALIARHGPAWFRSVGTEEQPGSALVTLSGAVTTPGVIEIPYGAPLLHMLKASAPVRAVLTGGYAGTWLSPQTAASLSWSDSSARSLGASLGAGIVSVLPEGSCGLQETLRIVTWMAAQSSRQCGPCLNGLPAIVAGLADLVEQRANHITMESLRRWCGMVEGRGTCAHPDGVVMTVRSALETFATDVDAHLVSGCEVAR